MSESLQLAPEFGLLGLTSACSARVKASIRLLL